MEKGTLYLCATPIGNLEDITLRALRVLRESDVVACEDTRRTGKLLAHFEIRKPMISYHKFNERARSAELLKRLGSGENIALVSDAGMPGISDPGFVVAAEAQAAGYSVTVVPGANAGLCALLLSTFSCERFVFEGFLPENKKERAERLAKLKQEQRTVIFYESPHNLSQTLQEMRGAFGNRRVCAVRELTKLYEESVVFSLEEYESFLQEHPPRGEYVLVLEGAQPEPDVFEGSAAEQVRLLMQQGMDKKSAVKEAARRRGVPKNEIYQQVLEL
ncbi:MAG: 16S rRNA (cytidine(1402)-2'-O)-methyltransferase [Clostridiales bacterium]|nr:16S rRNA (cytidine(1402)-2'-O)-methyltransferase [Clostridiales bacterium]